MARLLVAVFVALAVDGASAFAPSSSTLQIRTQVPKHACRLRMQESETQEPVLSETRKRGLDARRTSWLSRNLPEEQLMAKKYYDVENRGELLAGPDRSAAGEWGEELTEIGKWQRTNGPIYIQAAGGGLLLFGFVNYFALGNIGHLSQPIWTLSIFVALLGFALQRKTS
ncbi:hypothetical protein GUITHDRAFT_104120 [Guillardia theta CCMP2712]|uniref:Uncharacterized protein n=1 Tax=Guillardia theta (strain CCMP2712) TaxID=905079 RepID=L1JQ71_GUITC|nr:hypothetical protein GUITHDRAFT_104120 [Guillardia theta CCMP2712]EKX50310.1 hypothetical protein GUITHDRAFT_104120 [Guillardia theta CCMP2712]|mmetsp:Transcript_9372/g.31348  ORF Transcript_9372/g.31348 Transcript_9372/m.31348 type:complete len:170 (-) Transcript_9372:790-1299(-)|eukprot:XP_005837290.1 hypothetical protein GUITHDRAFT_104120 [Guillardia theta CCMP2712]